MKSMKSKPLIIFFTVFIASLLLQGIQWREFDMADSGMWGHEAQYVFDNDPREFNFLEAYGHPGGPIIEGAIAFHPLLKLPYDQAVLAFDNWPARMPIS